MVREASISQEQVSAIADSLRSAGEKPTARAIRNQLGRGSMSTIVRFIGVWSGQQIKVGECQVVLPQQLQKTLVDFVAQEISGAKAALEIELADTQKNLSDVIDEYEQQGQTVCAQAAELERMVADQSELAGRLGQVTADLQTTRVEILREREAAETARIELAKLQLRLESLPGLEVEIERLRKSLDGERIARTNAEREMAAAEAQAAGLLNRLADAQEQHRASIAIQEVRLAETCNLHQAALATAGARLVEQKQRDDEIIKKLEARVTEAENRLHEIRC